MNCPFCDQAVEFDGTRCKHAVFYAESLGVPQPCGSYWHHPEGDFDALKDLADVPGNYADLATEFVTVTARERGETVVGARKRGKRLVGGKPGEGVWCDIQAVFAEDPASFLVELAALADGGSEDNGEDGGNPQ
jgi:hypothetical protein